MKSFVWHEADSPLHHLNPLTKLAPALPVVVIVSQANNPLAPLAIAVLALAAIHLFGRVPVRQLVRPIGVALVLGFGMFWMGALFYANPGVSYSGSGPIGLTNTSLMNGVTMASRLLAIFGASLLFVLTTDPVKLVLALIHQAHMPYKIGYSVFAAYRFIPLLQEELENIRAAHLMRQGQAGGIVRSIRRQAGYAVPLLAIAVRKGERVALAMDARAFGALAQRTYHRRTSFGPGDAAFGILAGVTLAAIVSAAHLITILEGLP
jgi:energy-coupling factor transport system permease protein